MFLICFGFFVFKHCMLGSSCSNSATERSASGNTVPAACAAAIARAVAVALRACVCVRVYACASLSLRLKRQLAAKVCLNTHNGCFGVYRIARATAKTK